MDNIPNVFAIMDARLSVMEDLLYQIRHSSNFTPESQAKAPGKIMTIDDVADYAGIAKSTIYKLTSSGEMPHSKRGRRLYFDRDQIDTWLMGQPAHTKSDTETSVNEFLANVGKRAG